jgi:hypothetical protein
VGVDPVVVESTTIEDTRSVALTTDEEMLVLVVLTISEDTTVPLALTTEDDTIVLSRIDQHAASVLETGAHTCSAASLEIDCGAATAVATRSERIVVLLNIASAGVIVG